MGAFPVVRGGARAGSSSSSGNGVAGEGDHLRPERVGGWGAAGVGVPGRPEGSSGELGLGPLRADLEPRALRDHGDGAPACGSRVMMGCGDCPLLR